MKQFLYLDTDIVNSIVAQSQKGLVTQTTVEKEDNTTKNSRNTENISATGSGNIGGFWKFVELNSSLPKYISNFPYFTGFPACALAKRYVFSLIFALMR